MEQYGIEEDVGVFIFEAHGWGERVIEFEEDDVNLTFSTQKFGKSPPPEDFNVEEGKVYCALPCTFREQKQGRYRLTIPGIKLVPFEDISL